MPEQFEPWFGTWPPEYYGGEPEMEDTKSVRGRLLKLIVFAVIGVAFVVVSLRLSTTWQILFATLGSTSLLICGLGATVDWWMKKGILDDVVKESLGYMVPKELRPSMRWIYTQHIICTRHYQETEIIPNPADSETVIVRTTIQRDLENISGNTEEIHIGLAIDEWFENSRHSEIVEVGYRFEGNEISLMDQIKRTPTALVIEGNIVRAPHEKSVYTWFTMEEIKRAKHDVLFMYYSYPTKDPIVKVKAPEDFEITAGFAQSQYKDAVHPRGKGTVALSATLLPLQAIEVRWWQKGKSERWLNGQ